MSHRWKIDLPHFFAWLVAVLAVLQVLLVAQHMVESERQTSELSIQRDLSNLSRLTQEHANRTLTAADQALRLLGVLYLRDGSALDLPALGRQRVIDVGIFHQFGIIDAQGIDRLSNLPNTLALDWSDRDYFQVHANGNADALFVSKPVLGPVSKKWTIQLTRRITQPDGSFAGVAVVSVATDYFTDFYASLALGSTGAAALIGRDGVVRARRCTVSEGVGVAVQQSEVLPRLNAGQADGFVELVSPVDQIARMVSYRQLPDFPLYVTVGLGMQEVHAPMAATARTHRLLAALAAGLLLGAAALYSWHRVREQRTHQALAASHAQMNLALDGGGLGLWQWDLANGHFELDQRLLAILGYAPGEYSLDNAKFSDGMHPDDWARLREVLPPVLKGTVPRLLLEHRLKHKDGHWVWLTTRGRVVARDGHGRALRMVGTDVDRTAQMQAELSQRVAAVAFESSSAMLVSDAKQIILRVNPAFEALSGYSTSELVGQLSSVLKSGRHNREFYAAMWDSIRQTGRWEGEIWNRHKDGELFLDWLAITVVKDAQGLVTHYVSVHTDITQRKRSEEEVKQLAFYDPLTGLPNRRLLMDRLGQLAAALARSGQISAVLFMDLDHFKPLNDTYGHDQGDELLQQVAQRLLDCVREVDTVARFGGDEFVVTLAQLGQDAAAAQVAAQAVAQKIRAAVAAPFVLSNLSWRLSVSVGLALMRDVRQTADELLKRADQAMYEAKQAGRDAIHVTTSMPFQ